MFNMRSEKGFAKEHNDAKPDQEQELRRDFLFACMYY